MRREREGGREGRGRERRKRCGVCVLGRVGGREGKVKKGRDWEDGCEEGRGGKGKEVAYGIAQVWSDACMM